MTAYELNFDGLVGPTHHYGGLSRGNLASQRFRHAVSHPRAAAWQVLGKMKLLADLGLKQAVLPPHPRPHWGLLHAHGLTGSRANVIEQAARGRPDLLSQVYSSSFMWAANSCTVSPSTDTADRRVHITPANLFSAPHRALEAAFTAHVLRQLFADADHFRVHDPLPQEHALADEGAANHMRLCIAHERAGVEVFVYGRTDPQAQTAAPRTFPARQSREASAAVAAGHQLDLARTQFIQQSPAAIDAGAFHNDVVAVANENVLLCHEAAFVDQAEKLRRLRAAFDGNLTIVEVRESQLSLTEAVETYLFNSQLLTLPTGGMRLVCPRECEESERARSAIDRIVARVEAIDGVTYVDVRQSMRNGGGPACLRLRVVLTQVELDSLPASCMLTDSLYAELHGWIGRHFREQLLPADLADPALAHEAQAAQEEIGRILKLDLAC